MHRRVEYQYQYGRLVAMQTWPMAPSSSQMAQVTRVEYGADVVDEQFEQVSKNMGLIGRMCLPNENGSTIDLPEWISLRYNFGGAVAERTDARGVVQRYRYDDLGRLAFVQIGHYSPVAGIPPAPTTWEFVPGYPYTMTPTTGAPVDRIAYVKYEYDSRGNLTDVTARGPPPSSTSDPDDGVLITHTRFEHDVRGGLIAEWQSHGAGVSSTTPRIDYAWDYEPTGDPVSDPDVVGHHRLATITYPEQPGYTVRRLLTFNYGTSGSTDDALSRVGTITTNLGAAGKIAAYDYIGIGRRVGVSLANDKITHDAGPTTINGAAGFEGIDTFGRIRDLHYRNTASTPATLFRGEYTYTRTGGRESARITQAPVGTGSGSSRTNTHSQVNRYDALERLIATDVGVLQTASGGGLEIDPQSIVRSDAWQLDLLGNWIGGVEAGNQGVPSTPGGEGAPAPGGWGRAPDEGVAASRGAVWMRHPGATPGSSPLFATWSHAVNMQNGSAW